MVALAMTPQAKVVAIKSAKIIRMFAPLTASRRAPLVSLPAGYAASLGNGRAKEIDYGDISNVAWGGRPTRWC